MRTLFEVDIPRDTELEQSPRIMAFFGANGHYTACQFPDTWTFCTEDEFLAYAFEAWGKGELTLLLDDIEFNEAWESADYLRSAEECTRQGMYRHAQEMVRMAGECL